MIARAMSSIIPGARERISPIAPVRNGEPPQAYITVPSTGEIQAIHAASGNEYPRSIANISEATITGTARTSMLQNRRRNIPTWSP